MPVSPIVAISNGDGKSSYAVKIPWVIAIWLVSMIFGAGVSLAKFETKDNAQEKRELVRTELTILINTQYTTLDGKIDKILEYMLTEKGMKSEKK